MVACRDECEAKWAAPKDEFIHVLSGGWPLKGIFRPKL